MAPAAARTSPSGPVIEEPPLIVDVGLAAAQAGIDDEQVVLQGAGAQQHLGDGDRGGRAWQGGGNQQQVGAGQRCGTGHFGELAVVTDQHGGLQAADLVQRRRRLSRSEGGALAAAEQVAFAVEGGRQAGAEQGGGVVDLAGGGALGHADDQSEVERVGQSGEAPQGRAVGGFGERVHGVERGVAGGGELRGHEQAAAGGSGGAGGVLDALEVGREAGRAGLELEQRQGEGVRGHRDRS